MKKLTRDEIARNRYTADQLSLEPRTPVYVLLDNVRSLYNVGSIFRSADGARVAKIFLCGYTPYPPRKEIEKTALGSTATVPWEYLRDPLEAITRLKDQQIPVCALEHTDCSAPYSSLRKEDFPLCLVVGNEITGIGKDILRHADRAIDIPMFGLKQSLNVAVAFGIAVFECLRILQPEKGAFLSSPAHYL